MQASNNIITVYSVIILGWIYKVTVASTPRDSNLQLQGANLAMLNSNTN